ncbi:hypothetical protein BH09BAC3_BH09BAC3_16830 [soil metagenome]
MQVANFEYTDQSYTLKLIAISLQTLVLLLIVLISTKLIGVFGGFLVPFAVATAIFLYGKGKIRKKGTVVINDSHADFKLEEKDVNVQYADITTYHIERFNAVSLVIKFKDESKFRLMANGNFSNYLYLGNVVAALDKAIQEYQMTHNVVIERKPSIFARKWMLPLLIVFTSALIVTLIASKMSDKSVPFSFYSSIVVLIMLWVGYVRARTSSR